jgi:hypothetical protein
VRPVAVLRVEQNNRQAGEELAPLARLFAAVVVFESKAGLTAVLPSIVGP